jgi:hypothetical protein
MSDKELISMLVDKIDTMKDDINSRLDKHEQKLDAQTEKLNSFEVRAESVLAAHDKDIINLKEKVAKLDEKEAKKSSNPIYAFVNSEVMTIIFRFALILLMLLIGVKKTTMTDTIDLVNKINPIIQTKEK